MGTTDNAFSVSSPINTPKPALKQRWWHILDNWKVGIRCRSFAGRRHSHWTAWAASCRAYCRNGSDAGLFGFVANSMKRLPVLLASSAHHAAHILLRWCITACCRVVVESTRKF